MEADSAAVGRYKPRGILRVMRALAASANGLVGAFREEAAFRQGFLSLDKLHTLASKLPNCEYRAYLENVVAEANRLSPTRAEGAATSSMAAVPA